MVDKLDKDSKQRRKPKQVHCNCAYSWTMFATEHHFFDCNIRIAARRRARETRKKREVRRG